MRARLVEFLMVYFRICLLGLLLVSQSFSAEMSIERLDPAIDSLIPQDAAVETLAAGFVWAEGPVWIPDAGELLFSDVPNNVVHAWDGQETRIFMKPSGYTGVSEYGTENGSNGLALDNEGRILFAEHGDRRVSALTKGGGKITLADQFGGRRFNSPNDVVVHSSGDVYFTDPIYGLPGGADSKHRELDFCGVFRIGKNGEVVLVTKELERPIGLAFSPDEKVLYVANSHGPRNLILSVSINQSGDSGETQVFFDAEQLEEPGLMDGLKVDTKGNLWATGPGGLLVISPEGKLLGRVLTGRATANVAFGGIDGKTVFLTAKNSLLSFQRL